MDSLVTCSDLQWTCFRMMSLFLPCCICSFEIGLVVSYVFGLFLTWHICPLKMNKVSFLSYLIPSPHTVCLHAHAVSWSWIQSWFWSYLYMCMYTYMLCFNGAWFFMHHISVISLAPGKIFVVGPLFSPILSPPTDLCELHTHAIGY